MSHAFDADLGRYSEIMAGSLRGVADDLRSIDPVDLISYIRLGSFATLEDLLQSSTELFFRQGTLSFAWTARVAMDWGDLPTITLGMEFRHGPVAVFFDLWLRAYDEGVTICGVFFEGAVRDPDESLVHLRKAIAEARLPERSGCRRRPANRRRDGAAGT